MAVGNRDSVLALVFFLRKPIISVFAISSTAVVGYALEYLAIVGGLLVFQFVSSGFMASMKASARPRQFSDHGHRALFEHDP
jgi:Na+-driven multidrug efflux pump